MTFFPHLKQQSFTNQNTNSASHSAQVVPNSSKLGVKKHFEPKVTNNATLLMMTTLFTTHEVKKQVY